MLRHFGSSLSLPATRSPTPFNFPFSPLGLNLFDLDPSRMLSLLHHQSWLAEEALRNRTLFTPPKESPHRINPLGDFYATHLHANAPASNDLPLHLPQQTPYKTNSFNVRYPSMAAFFQHQHQQEQQRKHARQNTASPLQQSSSATSTLTNNNNNNTAGSPICVSPFAKQNSTGCDLLLEELKRKSAANCDRDDDATEIIELSSPNSDVKNNNNNNNSNMMDHNKSHTFKNNMNVTNNALDQFLQQRRSASTSLLMGDNFRSYSQLFLSSSANTPSCTDTSSCKEKSSSSSTSSTPPPSAALLAQQQLSHILKSPSESSLFGDNIEEETRCVVCNAHFPNVWLLEQHAALQHPHIGPGDEKPFICEQCGQSYRYRSAYAKHKEQNHRARLPADKLFTCDVCGMQFRYLKSFKKHRLNHALERLHGKKGVLNSSGALKPASNASFGEQDVVTSTQEAMAADNCGVEDLRINIKREQEEEEAQRTREEEQDNTVDSAGMNMLYNAENSSNTASTSVTEATITSSDVIYSTNKKQRLLQSTHTEADASLHCLQQQASQTLQTPQTHLHPGVLNVAGHHMSVPVPVPVSVTMPTATMHHGHQASTSLSSLNSLSSITSLINAERLPNEQFLGLNPQEASILNFLRVDAAERQRDKRPQASRFACPFCGKCVRSKENLKLHVRKHTGERPFVCLFCGRAFGGKSDLTRHLRIHTGERPYHCESCGKCFARADYLSKHLTTHIHNAPR